MAKLSRNTKEIIKTSLFLIGVALLITVYIAYPLNKTVTILARADIDNFTIDSIGENNPSFYSDAGLVVDTFWIESDGLTDLAVIYIPNDTALFEKSKGTVFLLHADGFTRDSMLTLAQFFHDSGYNVTVYDQRASGFSSGKYRGGGQMEADDLSAVISYLNLRGKIYHPLFIVGYELGGDAGIIASLTNPQIQAVIAVNPYLTSKKMQDILKEKYDLYWFPFFRTVMWFWYEIRSGYAVQYRNVEQIRAVQCHTLILMNEQYHKDNDGLTYLESISGANIFRSKEITENTNINDEMAQYIFNFQY